MTRAGTVLLAPLLLLASGCLAKIEVPEDIYSPCRAIASTGWSAHVERFPTAHIRPILKPMLVVEGKVTVPGPGYSVSLDLGPVDRLREPVQQVLVRAVGPDEASGPPQTHSVRGVFPARKRYGGVRIRCGDGTLALIPEVPRRD